MLRPIIARLRAPLLSIHRNPISFSPPPPPPYFLANPSPRPPWIFLHASRLSSKSARLRHDAGDDDGDEDHRESVFMFMGDRDRPPKLFVVQPRFRPDSLLDSKLGEALNLANSLEEQRDGFFEGDLESKGVPPHLVVQNPIARSARSHADTYFGPGTVENIKIHMKALQKDEVDAVFVNAILSGVQLRNLEVAWSIPVLDRVGLIIEIFNAHAETKEARLQSELAALMYKKTRLVRVHGPGGRLSFGFSGESEVVSARGRGSGGRGALSGSGETELHLQRRRIQERRIRLLSQIKEVQRTRALQRASRRRRGGSQGQGLSTIAVVGYTNAGKSTLVSALSESYLFSDDRLFATVDPRLRSVVLPSGRKVLLSDTVGFISDLPIQLVEAFHATLEEVVEADLLVHVLDSSAPNIDEQRSTVLQVLQQIGVAEEKIQNMLEVWNKIDLLEEQNEADGVFYEHECLGHEDGCTDGESEHSEGGEHVGEGGGSEGLMSAEEMIMELRNGIRCGGPVLPEADDEMAIVQLQDDGSVLSSSSEAMGGEKDIVSELFCGMLVCEEDDMVVDISEDHPADDLTSDLSLPKESRCSLRDFQVSVPRASPEPEAAGLHIKTSAVCGIGLQEVLELIDKKLDEQKPAVAVNVGGFDRKWRAPNQSSAAAIMAE